MSQSRRFVLAITVGVAVLWTTFAIVVYPDLPATFATHFGANGRANAFTDKSIMSWFLLNVVGLASTALTLGLAQMAERSPELYSVPGKLALLSLPKERQAPFLEELAISMTVLTLSVIVVFAGIQYDMWRVAVADQRGLSVVSYAAMALSFGGLAIAMPLWLLSFRNRVVAETQRSVGAATRRSS